MGRVYLPATAVAAISERIEAGLADDLADALDRIEDALEGARFPTEPAVAQAATIARAALALYAKERVNRSRAAHPSQWSVVR
jgi:hypothetical protein